MIRAFRAASSRPGRQRSLTFFDGGGKRQPTDFILSRERQVGSSYWGSGSKGGGGAGVLMLSK